MQLMEPINFKRELMRDRLTKAGRHCEVIPEPSDPIDATAKGWTPGVIYVYGRSGDFRAGKPRQDVVLGVLDNGWILEFPIEKFAWEVWSGAELVAVLGRALAATAAQRAASFERERVKAGEPANEKGQS